MLTLEQLLIVPSGPILRVQDIHVWCYETLSQDHEDVCLTWKTGQFKQGI